METGSNPTASATSRANRDFPASCELPRISTPNGRMLVPVIVPNTEVATTGRRTDYDTCDVYYGNGCAEFGVPFVGGLINGVLGGY